VLFARLEEEPDDGATLSALCDLALTRGQPELAQRLIRQARATGRELPKELQALARRANATPSVLPQAVQSGGDARSCCLLPFEAATTGPSFTAPGGRGIRAPRACR